MVLAPERDGPDLARSPMRLVVFEPDNQALDLVAAAGWRSAQADASGRSASDRFSGSILLDISSTRSDEDIVVPIGDRHAVDRPGWGNIRA